MRRMLLLADQKEWPLLSHLFEEADLGRMVVRLPSWDATGIKLAIEPNTLRSAMYLQFARSVAAGEHWRRCAKCTTWFAYGPGTRRSSAEYCSDACRKAAYLERQGGTPERPHSTARQR